MRERREVLVMVAIDEIVKILNWRLAPAGSYLRLEAVGLPEDARVERVNYDPSWNCWAVAVSHPSFDTVLPNTVLPRLLQEGRVAIQKRVTASPHDLQEPVDSQESSSEFFQRVMGSTK